MENRAPALRVAALTRLRKTRCLPIDGDILVDRGERVGANDVVARAALSGEVLRFNLAGALGIKPGDEVARYLIKSPGDAVQLGEVIAEKKGSFGMSGKVCTSPIDGTLTSGPTISGEILIAPHPQGIEIEALLPGEIVGILPRRGVIVEGIGAYVQCISSIGGESQGSIKVLVDSPHQTAPEDLIDDSCSGAILVAGNVNPPALRAALIMGVRAIIAGSITVSTFRWLKENPQPVTLLLTEGFGTMPIARQTFDLLRAQTGQYACVFTPSEDYVSLTPAEVFIPSMRNSLSSTESERSLAYGASVRIVRGELWGSRARVVDVPSQTRVLPSGIRSEVVRLALEDGREILVGRPNVELVD